MKLKRKVLIASPVREKPNILKKFLKNLRGLSADNLSVDFAFINYNIDPRSTALLRNFVVTNSIKIIVEAELTGEEAEELKINYLSPDMSDFKNKMIKIAIQQHYDFVFLVNSDLTLHPKTLIGLIAQEEDVFTEAFCFIVNKFN